MLAIPILSARQQWLPAGATAAAGLLLFAGQSMLWPTTFHNYLHAVELQFSYNHDFGISPTGIFSILLFHLGIPYSPASTIFYLLYALPVFAVLFYLSRLHLNGSISREAWTPVMLVGVFLLNPRIKEYDIVPLTRFMVLILWRAIVSVSSLKRAVIISFLFFICANMLFIPLPTIEAERSCWSYSVSFLLVGLFAVGCRNLLQQARLVRYRSFAVDYDEEESMGEEKAVLAFKA